MHFSPENQVEVLEMFHQALVPGGLPGAGRRPGHAGGLRGPVPAGGAGAAAVPEAGA